MKCLIYLKLNHQVLNEFLAWMEIKSVYFNVIDLLEQELVFLMIGNEKVHNKDFELEPEGKKIYCSVLIYYSKF